MSAADVIVIGAGALGSAVAAELMLRGRRVLVLAPDETSASARAAGMIAPGAAILFGALAAAVCYGAIQLVKNRWQIDDSLDVFAVHGVGGMLGSLMLGLFLSPALGGSGYAEGMAMGSMLGAQAVAVVQDQVLRDAPGRHLDAGNVHRGEDTPAHVLVADPAVVVLERPGGQLPLHHLLRTHLDAEEGEGVIGIVVGSAGEDRPRQCRLAH